MAWTIRLGRDSVRIAMRFLACCLTILVGSLSVPAQGGTAPPTNAASSAGSQFTPLLNPEVNLRLKHGDDPRWAAPEWDDRDWETITPDQFPARTGVYWVRIRVARGITEVDPLSCYSFTWPKDKPIDAIFIAAVFSFELWWDGRLLERSGVVGSSRAAEVPGPLDHLVRIPDDRLGEGEHVIALRISNYHYNFSSTQFRVGMAFVPFTTGLVSETRQPIVPLMLLAGAVLMTATTLVMLLFADRRRALLLCNLLSFALALVYGLVSFRWIYNAPYPWLAPRVTAIAVLIGVICVLLPWLLARQLAVMRRGQWLIGLVPLLILAWNTSIYHEVKSLWMCRAAFAVSVGVAAWAVWRRRPGAWLILGALVIGLFLVRTSGRTFLDPVFFLFLEGLVFFVFVMLGLQVRAERQHTRELLLTAARLETELLKKNIQPHFLLNTLATIIEMIEQTPRAAVALIEALASEFRILARASGEKLIPLHRELELCRAHLRIMSQRKGAKCSLEVEGLDDDAPIPPALFHTLIENGLTHLLARNGEQKFLLSARSEREMTRYVMTAYGEAQDVVNSRRDGTGMRYIKARLEESFPGRWRLESEPIPGGWRTTIEIRVDATDGVEPIPDLPIREPGREQITA